MMIVIVINISIVPILVFSNLSFLKHKSFHFQETLFKIKENKIMKRKLRTNKIGNLKMTETIDERNLSNLIF